jgi:hypothetical protein
LSTKILKQIREAVEQLNPNEVRGTAEQPIAVRLAAESSAGYAAMEDFLIPRTVSRKKRFELTAIVYRSGDPEIPEKGDLDIVEAGLDAPEGAFRFDAENPSKLVADVLADKQDLGLPLARAFPPFRGPVVEKIISNVARENAIFSIMTAMPDLAPGFSLPWAIPEAVSDTTVLTINQIRMAFLLAAASDRPVGYREQKAEIGSLVAGAFGWRTLARELASKIPFGGGIIPKAGIAFAGTYVAGLSLERLYRLGYGLTRAERKLAYGEALARGRKVAAGLLESVRNRRAAVS